MNAKILMSAAAALWLVNTSAAIAQQAPDRLSVSINTTQTYDSVTQKGA
jgi:hypothetical protein